MKIARGPKSNPGFRVWVVSCLGLRGFLVPDFRNSALALHVGILCQDIFRRSMDLGSCFISLTVISYRALSMNNMESS